MKKSLRTGPIIAVEVIVGLLIAAMVIFLSCYVTVGGAIYPRSGEALDLTGKQLTPEEYEALQEKLPDTKILWMVPLGSGPVRSDAKQITVTSFSEEDLELAEHLTELRTVYAEDCPDAVQLAELRQDRPKVEVLFSVRLGEGVYAPDSAAISVIGMTEAELPMLAALPELKELTIAGGTELSLVSRIQADYPQLEVKYIVTLGGTAYPGDTHGLTLKDADYETARQALALLPELDSLELIDPKATGDQLVGLREQYPQTQLRWKVDVCGLEFDDETVEMDVSGVEIQSLDALAASADCLPKLERLYLGECGLDNEALAALRESKRDSYKVVWAIRFTKKLVADTDVTTFMPGHKDIGEYRFNESMGVNVQDLKYFEDIVCMDLGHHIIYKIDFVSYMPHLKFLILSWTEVHDLSPLTACKELIYLELDYSQVRDFTPLVEMKSLEDLNVCGTVADVAPLTQMTWLKNLWASDRSYAAKMTLVEAFPQGDVLDEEGNVLVPKCDTHLHVSSGNSATTWRHLPHYYEMRDMLGMYYMNQ